MRIALFIICFIFSLSAYSQQPGGGHNTVQYSMTKEEMMAKRKEIQDAIKETEKQLEAIKNDKQATMGQLRALQNKLAERQRLIGHINDEMAGIDQDIRRSSKEVMTLRQKFEMLKMRYVQSIRFSYENRSSYSMLTFMFSANDFNDMVRRMKYLKKFREYRRQQVEQIRSTQVQLQRKIGVLNAEKAEKDDLLSTQIQQKRVLISETDQTNKVIQDLKGKESQLLKDIEKHRQLTVRINKAIENMIAAEMAKAAKNAEAAAAKAAPASKAPEAGVAVPRPARPKGDAPELLLTPTDIALANDFEGNKGKLYWPVERGYITDHFGAHPHPLAPKVMIDNAGVDIQTDANASVRAVFEGTVTNIFSTVGSNSQIIMIKHGNYFTVYSGLATVAVTKGQQVGVKQVLGKVAINDEDLPVVNFQIWKSSGKSNIKLNPEAWIGKAR
jgi:septal ring factor EnvC (AmiA/AmiB activator)